ncbi:hypothetical protein, partial [Hungatella sp.]
MKQWLDTADEYIKSWKIRDVALLKLCVCAAGFLFGMGIPKRHRNKASIAASIIFSVTYVLVMLPFLKLL